ncbi:hypothetical protein HIM_01921 [Hirsutella minnesotensis 3608]|nr:hypothetical protein HIM_01921 [Hirsutella minnesotensis 3608]
MDESAPKRRRVSSQATPAVGDSSQGTASEASNARRQRPSFASPTKASLSRHNPQILERRRSASPAKPTARRNSIAASEQSLSELLRVQPTQAAEDVAASDIEQPDVETRETEAAPDSERTNERIGGALAAPPRRSPAKPNPRPLPPPPPDGEDELNPFIGHTLRRSPTTGVNIPPPPEPELPPAVADAVSSTPPRGIHSSPSRWKEKRKAKKISPLKPKAKKPEATASKKRHGSSSRDRQDEQEKEAPSLIALDPSANRARQVPAITSDAAKLKRRDNLRQEIEKLKSDLKTAGEENERIRLMQSSGRTITSSNEDEMAEILQCQLIAPREAPRPALSHQLMQTVLNPMLLPFGRQSSVAAPAKSDHENFEDIKSHHPVSMTAENELPFLQLFSPFSVTSSIAILPPKPDQPIRQRRLTTLRSRDVPGLFTAKLEIIINAMNLSIMELNVTSLDPRAKFELQPFVDKICSGQCNRTMQRNVGVLVWAMGEWCRVAILRAQLWTRLQRHLGSREKLLESVAEAREARKSQREGIETDHGGDKDEVVETADLLRFLGQQSFEIQVPSTHDAGGGSSLRLEWKIDFDWTGEAQSNIALLLGVPGKWRKADERGVFGKLPRLFENLTHGGQEPEEAVRVVAALLAGM